MILRSSFALALALCAVAHAAPRLSRDMPAHALPFDILARPSDRFSTEGRFAGTYRVGPGYIEVNFEVASILAVGVPNHRHGRVISEVKIGLAHFMSGQQWKSSNLVTLATPDKFANVGESVQLKPGTIRIPISETLDLAKHWFLVEITLVNPFKTDISGSWSGTCYAHSRTDIFAIAK